MIISARDLDASGIGKRQIPPYTSYLAFESLLRRAASEGVPAQIDKQLLVNWDIATGNELGLLTSLKSLGIIDEEGRPTELYREIRLSPPRRVAALRHAADLAYPGLGSIGGSIDDDRLHDYFVEERGLTGQMVDKAIRFYRQLASAAGPDPSSGDLEATRRGGSPARSNGSRSAARLTPGPKPTSGPPARLAPSGATVSADLEALPDELRLNLLIQVSPAASEAELADLFRRVRRAWRRASAEGADPLD